MRSEPRLRRHKVGFIFQRFNLLPTLDAYGQYRAGPAYPRQRIRSAPLRRGHQAAGPDATGCVTSPSELSGGEQQRVAIARAIINEPKIVLADEPTGNLDTKNSEAVLGMLRQLNRDLGQTIVMITHNPEAAAYGHRVVHMRDGMIVDGSLAN